MLVRCCGALLVSRVAQLLGELVAGLGLLSAPCAMLRIQRPVSLPGSPLNRRKR